MRKIKEWYYFLSRSILALFYFLCCVYCYSGFIDTHYKVNKSMVYAKTEKEWKQMLGWPPCGNLDLDGSCVCLYEFHHRFLLRLRVSGFIMNEKWKKKSSSFHWYVCFCGYLPCIESTGTLLRLSRVWYSNLRRTGRDFSTVSEFIRKFVVPGYRWMCALAIDV